MLNRGELAILFGEVAASLAKLETCASIQELCGQFASSLKQASEKHTKALASMRVQEEKPRDNTERKLNFHAVQIACDLFTLGLVQLDDNGADCPLSTGSNSGMKLVRRWEDQEATVKSLAQKTGRQPHEIQTSLCEFSKYTRWFNFEQAPKAR